MFDEGSMFNEDFVSGIQTGILIERERIVNMFANAKGDGDQEWDDLLDWVISQVNKEIE